MNIFKRQALAETLPQIVFRLLEDLGHRPEELVTHFARVECTEEIMRKCLPKDGKVFVIENNLFVIKNNKPYNINEEAKYESSELCEILYKEDLIPDRIVFVHDNGTIVMVSLDNFSLSNFYKIKINEEIAIITS